MIQGEYEYFDVLLVVQGEKTNIYRITTRNGVDAGVIKWYGPWRKYCFFPSHSTIWDTKCLNEVVKCLDRLMEVRKK